MVATYEFLGLVIGIMEDPKKDLSSLYCTCSMSREVSRVPREWGRGVQSMLQHRPVGVYRTW